MDISVILSIVALVISVITFLITFYFTYLKYGKLEFNSPLYIAAVLHPSKTKAKNDSFILPIAVKNTGIRNRLMEFKVIVNDKEEFEHYYDYSDQLPIDEFEVKREGNTFASTPLLVSPLGAGFKNAAFIYHKKGYLTSLKKTIIVDLWYVENKEWKHEFRFEWDWNSSFKNKIKDYNYGKVVIAQRGRGFQVIEKHPTYKLSNDGYIE